MTGRLQLIHRKLLMSLFFLLITGERHIVTKVRVTNRADCCAERTSNLRVGVTDNAPAPGQFVDPDSYTLCGEIPGNYMNRFVL